MKLKFLLPALLLGSAVFAQTIAPVQFASGFNSITEITHAGTSRMYVVEQGGSIRMLEADGTVNATPFLNIASLITFSGEQGLLGLAFHPDYATNGFFYVYYINTSGNIAVARYSRSTNNADIADASSGLVLFTIPHPDNTNHNGGCMRFGPDGYLYISVGDGGGAGDIPGNAQNTGVLLGKMLRIDVTNSTTYTIPDTNPFIVGSGEDEIWAYGLRNAWKFSFNRLDGTLWIADVGQGQLEEINKVDPTLPGLNFGWRCYEGNSVYNDSGCPNSGTLTFPVAQYGHTGGACSITGGYVYTGNTYSNLQDKYFFADYCNSKIGWINSEEPGAITWTESFDGNFTTFAEDMNGEVYVAGGGNGIIYRITDADAGTSQFNASGIAIYPNPAHNEVSITIKNQSAPAQVTIYDLGGKRLMQQSLAINATRIDVSALQAGLYLIEVDVSGAKTQHKLVIN